LYKGAIRKAEAQIRSVSLVIYIARAAPLIRLTSNALNTFNTFTFTPSVIVGSGSVLQECGNSGMWRKFLCKAVRQLKYQSLASRVRFVLDFDLFVASGVWRVVAFVRVLLCTPRQRRGVTRHE
jgi:hypothetical protein